MNRLALEDIHMDRATVRFSFIGVLIAALLVAFLGMLAIVGMSSGMDTPSAQADATEAEKYSCMTTNTGGKV